MKRRLLKYGSIVAAIAFLAVFYGLAIRNTPGTEAVKATDFNPGRIIDDAIFYNPDTMTVEEIQAFLDAKLPTCDMWGTGSSAGRVVSETGYVMPAGSTNADYARLRAAAGNSRYHEPPYVCVNKYYENPETHETLYETKGIVKDGMISAAQIIYNEAHKYNINPQVLLVLLKKESYVWGDTWPLKWEYNSAMGYGCPDTAPCDTAYYGFYNQVHMAAYQFDRYKQKNYEYNYHPGMINNIYYSPDYSCGTKQVYIENMATASLYIYTPYTPNDAALANYPGTSYCGSYGNRNFFMYFSEWFGSTYGTYFSSMSIPRSLKTTIDSKKVNISLNNFDSNLTIAKDTVIEFDSLTYWNGELCLRSKEDTANLKNVCTLYSDLEEIPGSEYSKMSIPRVLITNKDGYFINTSDAYEKEAFAANERIVFDEKTTVKGILCLRSSSDTANGKNHCISYNDLDELPSLSFSDMVIPRTLYISKDARYLDTSTGLTIDIKEYGAQFFSKLTYLDGELCLQLQSDLSTKKCILYDGLREYNDAIFSNMSIPRQLKVVKTTNYFDPTINENSEEVVEAGSILSFNSLYKKDNELCLRTDEDSNNNVRRCIPYSLLDEIPGSEYLPMAIPRKIRVARDTHYINTSDAPNTPAIKSETILMFTHKTYINNNLCLKPDSEYNYCIYYDDLAEF